MRRQTRPTHPWTNLNINNIKTSVMWQAGWETRTRPQNALDMSLPVALVGPKQMTEPSVKDLFLHFPPLVLTSSFWMGLQLWPSVWQPVCLTMWHAFSCVTEGEGSTNPFKNRKLKLLSHCINCRLPYIHVEFHCTNWKYSDVEILKSFIKLKGYPLSVVGSSKTFFGLRLDASVTDWPWAYFN